jgi:hypothetical protein
LIKLLDVPVFEFNYLNFGAANKGVVGHLQDCQKWGDYCVLRVVLSQAPVVHSYNPSYSGDREIRGIAVQIQPGKIKKNVYIKRVVLSGYVDFLFENQAVMLAVADYYYYFFL